MDDGSRLPWLIAAALLCCAAYFAAAETAIASCSRNRIKTAAERGDPRAQRALRVLDDFDRAISTLLICTNVVHLSIAALVTVAVTRQWGMSAVSVSTVLTTLAVFFAGEMLPKSAARKYPVRVTLACAGTVSVLMRLLSPLSALLSLIGRAASSIAGEEEEASVTEDELYDIIEDMTEEGGLDEEQSELISSALQFGELTVESILTPRVDLVAVNIDSSLEEILSVVKAQNHSRLPVYEGSIDNIVGILQIRKFMKEYLRAGDSLRLRPLLSEPFFTHQSANIDALLRIMSKRRLNMAIVTDNYGGTVGLVTVEDILEELVGEIWDEDDVVRESVVRLPDGSFLVDADESVSDVFEAIEYEDEEDDEELVHTRMGEWAYEQFPSIPGPGDSFQYHGLSVTVSGMEHNRIRTLSVALLPQTAKGGEAQ